MSRVDPRLRVGFLGVLIVLGVLGVAALRTDGVGSQSAPVTLRAARAVREVAASIPRLSLPSTAQGTTGEEWVSLVERPWRAASTGWQVLADFDTPIRDTSFTYEPIAVAGQTFARGISTYPFSEIVYDLGGRALQLEARVGVTDDSKQAAGSVRFYVYGDEFLLYESDVVRAGEASRDVDLRIEGLQQLRLVVDDAGDGSLGDYAVWAEPRILLGQTEPDPEVVSLIAESRAKQEAAESPVRVAEWAALQALAEVDAAAVGRLAGAGAETVAGFDASSSAFVLANEHLVTTFGYGGVGNGRLRVLRRGAEQPTLADVVPSVVTRDGRVLKLSELTAGRVEGDNTRRIENAELGPASQLTARFRAPEGSGAIVFTLTVADREPVVELRLVGEGIALQTVRYLDPDTGGLVLGDDVQYLTDRSHLYTGDVRPDGHRRRAALEATKPALLWSETAQRGILFTLYDYAPSPIWLSMRRQPGTESIALGIELSASLGDFGPAGTTPPALTMELTEGPVGGSTFRRFQRVTQARYPAVPWPVEARYQWGSWYAYGPGVSAAGLQRQMDLLAANFTDLGPWLFAVDAGWYVQYGREDAELTSVDFEKFPEGVRGVADAAHARGMNVILYLGTGFVHDSPADGGEWLALRGLIEHYPQWLIPFQCEGGERGTTPLPNPPPQGGREQAATQGGRDLTPAKGQRELAAAGAEGSCRSPSGVRRYLLDYANPEVRAYIADIIRDFFLVHGADGILLDGVADAEGQLIPRVERDAPDGPPRPLLPTLELYRFIREEAERYHPGAFIESGWLHPTAADPYLTVFWYGDDVDDVDAPYPFAGFLQRLDYALFSRLALGQRPYIGTSSGDPALPHSRWRLQAAVALGTHATLSYDLGRMTPQTVAGFRADLAALDPFQGTPTFGPGLFPDTFATTRDGVTYVGVVNRAYEPRTIMVPFAAHGLAGRYTAFNVQGGTAQGVEGDFAVEVPARGFRLLALRRDPGVLWTDSVAAADCGAREAACGGGMSVTVRGPAQVPGFLQLATPPPTAVLENGVLLRRAATTSTAGTYAYDDESGLLSLAYSHQREQRIEVHW